MRIGYLVGRLGRGGAELQMMRLASAFAGRGHTVEVFAYDGGSSLDAALRAGGVGVRTADAVGRWAKRQAVRRWLSAFDPDLVHGVMKRPSSLALLARFPERRPPVLASDMSTATYGRHKPVFWASMAVFGLADGVVTETELNRRNLARAAPWLASKTTVIRNGLDVDRYVPPVGPGGIGDGVFRFCVVGTVYTVKDPKGVVRAVAELRSGGVDGFEVHWYGRLSLDGDAGVGPNEAVELARELGVDDVVRFHGETDDVERAYREADALLHASVQEGFPNAVAEGMASGLPIVVSDVSDLPRVVESAGNGFVFPARDVAALREAMRRMLGTPAEERRAMGERSRELAVRWFGLERFVDEFEALYRRLIDGSS